MKNILIVGGGFAGVMASVNAADQIDQHGGDLVVKSWARKSAQDDRWSFCLTAGTL